MKPVYDIVPVNDAGWEGFAAAMEESSRRLLLALGICPRHDRDLHRVEGEWLCPECVEEEHLLQPNNSP